MRAARVLFLCGVLLFSGGCFLGKKPVVQTPVTAPVTPAPAPAPAQQPVAASPPVAPVGEPAAPATAPYSKPSPFPPTATPPKPAPVTPAPAPAPALGALLTPDQRRQLDTAYQSDLRQANAALAKLNGRSLTTEQAATVGRARAFITQAAQYHDHDLITAAELARRARVLTLDLAGILK